MSITLLSHPDVGRIPVRDEHQALVALHPEFTPGDAAGTLAGQFVRAGVARRLDEARAALPSGFGLRVQEGFRTASDQQAIIAGYAQSLRQHHPGLDPAELHDLTSHYVAPLAVAPHVAGAAVDLTLTDGAGNDLWMGCALDATPEESEGACYFAADVGPAARGRRQLMASVLTGAGLVNYPTEWWHWSFGDRYWALITGAGAALYGPVTDVGAELNSPAGVLL